MSTVGSEGGVDDAFVANRNLDDVVGVDDGGDLGMSRHFKIQQGTNTTIRFFLLIRQRMREEFGDHSIDSIRSGIFCVTRTFKSLRSRTNNVSLL